MSFHQTINFVLRQLWDVSCYLFRPTVTSVVDHYVSNGSTVNLCALDVSKAFDKMSHYGLFINLMIRLYCGSANKFIVI